MQTPQTTYRQQTIEKNNKQIKERKTTTKPYSKVPGP